MNKIKNMSAIGEIVANLHKNINEEFKKINWIEKRFKLLKKYEKILTKSNLKENLRREIKNIFRKEKLKEFKENLRKTD